MPGEFFHVGSESLLCWVNLDWRQLYGFPIVSQSLFSRDATLAGGRLLLR